MRRNQNPFIEQRVKSTVGKAIEVCHASLKAYLTKGHELLGQIELPSEVHS